MHRLKGILSRKTLLWFAWLFGQKVHSKQVANSFLELRRVSQRTNSAIRMTMGMGMPSIKSKIERIVSLLNQF